MIKPRYRLFGPMGMTLIIFGIAGPPIGGAAFVVSSINERPPWNWASVLDALDTVRVFAPLAIPLSYVCLPLALITGLAHRFVQRKFGGVVSLVVTPVLGFLLTALVFAALIKTPHPDRLTPLMGSLGAIAAFCCALVSNWVTRRQARQALTMTTTVRQAED